MMSQCPRAKAITTVVTIITMQKVHLRLLRCRAIRITCLRVLGCPAHIGDPFNAVDDHPVVLEPWDIHQGRRHGRTGARPKLTNSTAAISKRLLPACLSDGNRAAGGCPARPWFAPGVSGSKPFGYCFVMSNTRFSCAGPNEAQVTTPVWLTPGLDQSHTPLGKIRFRRATSAGENVTA